MSVVIPGTLILGILLLVTWLVFGGMLNTSASQTESLRESNELRAEHLRTLVSITSTASSGDGYAAAVYNKSRGVSFGDFSELDLFARYVSTGGDTVATRLAYPSQWKVSSITGDTTNPNIWDPTETANLYFTLQPELLPCSEGVVSVTVPGGVSDLAYFDAKLCSFYWHNDPTPPTTVTSSHAVLAMTSYEPSATTLYNYDTDRDTDVGLLIRKGGSGVGETDLTQYQVWRTGPISDGLAISGDVTVDFWSALKDFKLNATGSVTIFLRDYDGVSSYTEIGNSTISDSDWQGGISDFIQKTISIMGLSYTIPVDHELEAKLIVESASGANMWLAYDTTSRPSIVNIP